MRRRDRQNELLVAAVVAVAMAFALIFSIVLSLGSDDRLPTPQASATGVIAMPPTFQPTNVVSSATASATNTPTTSATNTPTPNATASATNTPTASATNTPTPSATASATNTPTASATNTPTASATASATRTPTASATTVALTIDATPSATTIPHISLIPECIPRLEWMPIQVDIGDTSFSIARRYGITTEELARANCLADPAVIFAGQLIRVPTPPNEDALLEGCTNPGVLLTRPYAGETLTGLIAVYGIARGTDFRQFILDWRSDRPNSRYRVFDQGYTNRLFDAPISSFDARPLAAGLYWIRLRALDMNDVLIGECAVRVRVR